MENGDLSVLIIILLVVVYGLFYVFLYYFLFYIPRIRRSQINYLLTNCSSSGNEIIANYIQKRISPKVKWISPKVKWISYNQFLDIRKLDENDFFYLAKWKDDPLHWDDITKSYIRILDKEVILMYLYNLQNIDNFVNKVVEYSRHFELYGISQNPSTMNYIIVLRDDHNRCIECKGNYTNARNKWCKPCHRYFLYYYPISKNKKVDDFIAKKRIETNDLMYDPMDNVFEWIPYDQFYDTREIDFFGVYLAKWKNGPIYWDINNIDEFLNEVEAYSINFDIFGITQNPDTDKYMMVFQEKIDKKYCIGCNKVYTNVDNKWCKQCLMSYLRKYSPTSGNDKIDNFVQKKQKEINNSWNIVFEWIPHIQLNSIKEMSEDSLFTDYSAIWNDGLLCWETWNLKYIRKSDEVILRYLHNLQNIDEFLNKVNQFLITKNNIIYGISQNPDTKDHIIVFQDIYCEKCDQKYTNLSYKWCKTCQIKDLLKWINRNEKIDNFIQERLEEINDPWDNIFEWIPYNQFNDIKKVNKDNFSTVYSAKWVDGPLFWETSKKKYIRGSDKEVALKYLHNLQDIDEFLNNVIENNVNYGISQDPDTKDYIIVFQDIYCEKCNKKYTNISYKWCKSCQIKNLTNLFDEIEKVCENEVFKAYSAKWMDGPLYLGIIWNKKKYIRESDKKVTLKHLRKLQNIDKFLNKVKQVLFYDKKLYGISQNPITNDYIIVLQDEYYTNKKQTNKKVALKCLYNSLNITDEFLNEVKKYSINNHGNNILRIYGLSQNPDTKEYIIILEYAEGGNFNNWMNKNYRNFSWSSKINTLYNISNGLKEIHQKRIVHRDLHTGNILFFINDISVINSNMLSISDMGLCGEVDNMDDTKIYGVIPYVAPEVLRGKSYTPAADVYSFGMIMYFTATGRQPFTNRAHDGTLALDICNGIRPEINELKAPKCYIDLMKKCWDPNLEDRPNSIEVYESILQFQNNGIYEEQFKEVEEYRKASLLSNENNLSVTHPHAVYISRSLNSFTKDLPDNDTKCLDYKI
ncbi:kinase-like domain-containing protein [Rhizophagus clarus]|uniref:Kinase-like domain-containing protein n=1 Tax=Rhizophagus clarus TaxID=94130 RepID=A0A8H3QT52_9GLOM|nr:kinase-like domain-containing protein [Rhizophagus clarus]